MVQEGSILGAIKSRPEAFALCPAVPLVGWTGFEPASGTLPPAECLQAPGQPFHLALYGRAEQPSCKLSRNGHVPHMTRTLSIGKDRLLESSLSTFDGRSAPASRKTAARPTCRRAVPCPRVPQLVRPAPRLFRRGGGRQPGNRACRSPGAHGERRAPVARSRARDLPGRRRAIPCGRRRPPNRPASVARPEPGYATLAHCPSLKRQLA